MPNVARSIGNEAWREQTQPGQEEADGKAEHDRAHGGKYGYPFHFTTRVGINCHDVNVFDRGVVGSSG